MKYLIGKQMTRNRICHIYRGHLFKADYLPISGVRSMNITMGWARKVWIGNPARHTLKFYKEKSRGAFPITVTWCDVGGK